MVRGTRNLIERADLAGRDRVLLAILALLWTACLLLHVRQGATGRLAWPGVRVSSPPDRNSYPPVVGFRGGFGGEKSGLRVGDLVTRIGEFDARGLAPLMFIPHAMAEADAQRRVRIDYLRDGAPGEATLVLQPFPSPWWRLLPFTFSWAAMGVLVLWRAKG